MKKIHFIGICGKGMSAVAKLCMDLGFQVSGSDEGFYPPVSTYIEKNNIPFTKGYNRENISADVDVVVIGKHAKLVPEECEEVKYAFELRDQGKVEIKSFPEVLKIISEGRKNLVVCGSYGKSTCTAMLSHILSSSKLDIGYFIGATPITPKENAHLGTDEIFVLEGDEYPSANWDMSSKFLYYNPYSALLTSLAHDHTNIFKTHQDFKETFFSFLRIIKSGNLTLCLDDESILNERQRVENIVKNPIYYSFENILAKYYGKNFIFGEISSFDFVKENQVLGRLETKLLGKHNIQNIIGVVAFILENCNLSFDQISPFVLTFVAVEGRLNELQNNLGLKVFEGFGSSVDKAKSAISAIKLHFPDKAIKIIFEPHTFSWRNKEAIQWYDEVFSDAKTVYVYQPPQHGSSTISQLTQEEIVARINSSGVHAVAVFEHGSALNLIKSDLNKSEDIVLTLSSGNFDGLIEKLIS